MSAIVEGLGAWLPPKVITNEELSRRLDTSDAWIESRTGIRQRHVAEGISTGQMAVHAASRALASAGRTDVDLLVLATTTPDRPCPATAPEVASALGLAGIPAFDISAVCTGFLYALATAAGLLSTAGADRALVVAAEAFSTILDPADRGTVPIFGDGAGAVVLRSGEPDELGALGEFVLGSDGKLADLITVRGGGAAERTGALTATPADRFFQMRGREVFADAVMRMTEAAAAAMKLAGWHPTEVDWFVGHQANLRILHAVSDQLDLPPERMIVHLDEVGNTAAASIPLALAHGQLSGRLQPGQRIVLAAFGGGATWGATTLRWPGLAQIDGIT
jgi:3-oxoacyl-[acyl-carrier-protein] synthase-3